MRDRERRNTPLFAAFTAAGVLGGLFAREVIDGPGQQARTIPAYEQPAGEREPIEVEVYSVVEFPTATTVPSPTPTPKRTPTPGTPIEFCSTPQPGEACRIPPPPPPTPTPYPDCETALATPDNANDICVWRATPSA